MPELDVAIEAAYEAGNSILEIYEGKYETFTKSDDSPITEADLKSNEIIKAILSKTNHKILSEEDKDDQKRLSEEIIWIVDPLDGTSDLKDKWEEISVTKVSELSKCKVVGSRHHLSEKEKMFIKKLGIKDFTSIGSSLKVGKISSGEAEAYITTTNKMKEWDSAASYCLISEAGGKMTDMSGNDITYNNKIVNHQNGILVTNGLIHDKIVKEFN